MFASYEHLKKMTWDKCPGVPLFSPVSCLWIRPDSSLSCWDCVLLHSSLGYSHHKRTIRIKSTNGHFLDERNLKNYISGDPSTSLSNNRVFYLADDGVHRYCKGNSWTMSLYRQTLCFRQANRTKFCYVDVCTQIYHPQAARCYLALLAFPLF